MPVCQGEPSELRGRKRTLVAAAARAVPVSHPMRAPNYYAHPGFERAGLRRREPEWIRERVLDPASVFIPVWRNQNLVIELDDSEPRAASITVEGVVSVFGEIGDIDERLAHGQFVFLGVIDER